MSALEDELLDIAHEAARAAGAELRARFGQRPQGVRSKSGPTDLVSDADVCAEAAIRRVLDDRRPHDAFLGEEGGESGDGDLRWVVDPLDGTTNFLLAIPQFAVSVACEDRDGALAGVVLDPIRGEMFAATRSGKPTLDGTEIRGSVADELTGALVATGFGYDAPLRAKQAAVLSRLIPEVRDIRRAGSAALDLAWCACGRYDAYYERGLQPWDRAAGALLAARAGLSLRELEAGDDGPAGLLVAPPALADELLGLVLGP